MRVRVVPDLVPGLENRLDDLRVAIRRPPRDEEGRGQRVLAQQVEDARNPDERTVSLMRHHSGVARVETALDENRRFRVDVERETRK